jgi:DNA-binding MarR family transcriptional regulator
MGSITQLVDRLAREGLVTREADPRDRRKVRIALTEEGARIAQRGARVYDRIHALALEGVPPEALDRIDDGVRELLDILERREGD